MLKTATLKVVLGSGNYERKGLPLYFLFYFISRYKTQNISKKIGWQGCALYIIHTKIHPKIGIFNGILQKCSILPNFDDLNFHDRAKFIKNFICFNILDVFKCILTLFSFDLNNLDFGGQIRPLPHIVLYIYL